MTSEVAEGTEKKIGETKVEVGETKGKVGETEKKIQEGWNPSGRGEEVLEIPFRGLSNSSRKIFLQVARDAAKIFNDEGLSEEEKINTVLEILKKVRGKLPPEVYAYLVKTIENRFSVSIPIIESNQQEKEKYKNKGFEPGPHVPVRGLGAIPGPKIAVDKGSLSGRKTNGTSSKKKHKPLSDAKHSAKEEGEKFVGKTKKENLKRKKERAQDEKKQDQKSGEGDRTPLMD